MMAAVTDAPKSEKLVFNTGESVQYVLLTHEFIWKFKFCNSNKPTQAKGFLGTKAVYALGCAICSNVAVQLLGTILLCLVNDAAALSTALHNPLNYWNLVRECTFPSQWEHRVLAGRGHLSASEWNAEKCMHPEGCALGRRRTSFQEDLRNTSLSSLC